MYRFKPVMIKCLGLSVIGTCIKFQVIFDCVLWGQYLFFHLIKYFSRLDYTGSKLTIKFVYIYNYGLKVYEVAFDY